MVFLSVEQKRTNFVLSEMICRTCCKDKREVGLNQKPLSPKHGRITYRPAFFLELGLAINRESRSRC
jgi:hypothetical protein